MTSCAATPFAHPAGLSLILARAHWQALVHHGCFFTDHITQQQQNVATDPCNNHCHLMQYAGFKLQSSCINHMNCCSPESLHLPAPCRKRDQNPVSELQLQASVQQVAQAVARIWGNKSSSAHRQHSWKILAIASPSVCGTEYNTCN